MAERVEEKFLDVLQNIEFALVGVFREHDKLTDYGADYAIETLIKQYTAELLGRTPPPLPKFPPHEQQAYDNVRAMCEWRLGRADAEDGSGQEVNPGEPIALADLIACLKRIRSSIQFWTKKLGRRGYYEFVKGFVK